MNQRFTLSAIVLPVLLLINASAAAEPATDKRTLERGRYLVSISGCNDCHTPGYPEAAGKLPAAEWLTGSPVGFQGPWGTTYPVNLRLYTQGMSEAQWIARVRQPMRPPMPWFSLRDMSDTDLVAMYRFIRALGARGEPAPAYAPPGVAVNTPYFEFVPKNLPKQARASH
jgi:mono/diheme cytochrome c family protein